MIEFLRNKIEHVIYIIKENKTCDQVSGNLPPAKLTFGLLDNFTTAAR